MADHQPRTRKGVSQFNENTGTPLERGIQDSRTYGMLHDAYHWYPCASKSKEKLKQRSAYRQVQSGDHSR